MVVHINDIWRVPAYLPYVQPALTSEALLSAENTLGYKLPIELVRLLEIQNGGYIRPSTPHNINDVIKGIGPYFPSLTDIDLDEWQEFVTFPLKGLVPFDDDGRTYLCLDYRDSVDSPSVTLIGMTNEEQYVVAKSFSEYLSILKFETDRLFVIEDISNIDAVLHDLSLCLKISFDSLDLSMYGYSMYLANMSTSETREWLRISPNDVPKGFIRPQGPRYAQLKNAMPGAGKQYPMLPDKCLILSVTDGACEALIKGCSEIYLPIYPLAKYVSTERKAESA